MKKIFRTRTRLPKMPHIKIFREHAHTIIYKNFCIMGVEKVAFLKIFYIKFF